MIYKQKALFCTYVFTRTPNPQEFRRSLDDVQASPRLRRTLASENFTSGSRRPAISSSMLKFPFIRRMTSLTIRNFLTTDFLKYRKFGENSNLRNIFLPLLNLLANIWNTLCHIDQQISHARQKERNLFSADHFMTEKLTQKTGSCLLYTSPSPRDLSTSRMPSSA